MPYGGHDQLWKELIRELPADFLTLTVPDLAARIDLGNIRFQPEEHYLDSPEGRQRRLDLVAKVTERSSTAKSAVLHAEVELDFRSRLPLRWWRYNRVLFLRHGLPVHTIVVYLRGGPPGVTRSVYRETSLGREVASFRYVSLGLSRASASELLARPEPLAWALAALTRPRPQKKRAQLRLDCLRRIAAASELDPRRRFMLFNCVVTYVESDERAAEEFEALLAEHGNQEVRDMLMTWAEKIETRGYDRARAEDLTAMRDLLQRLLEQRFGGLPQKVIQQISEISSLQKLTRMAEQIHMIKDLEDLELA